MGYGENLNKRMYNNYYSHNNNTNKLPLRSLNNRVMHTNSAEINRAIQKRLIKERIYKIYKMKMQLQNNVIKDTNINKKENDQREDKEKKEEKELLLTDIYTNEDKIIYNNTKSEHFKDYDSISENSIPEDEEEELNEYSIDTDIDSD